MTALALAPPAGPAPRPAPAAGRPQFAAAAGRPQFVQVPVAGHDVLAVRQGDEVRIPMKALCGTLGLDWPPQARRLRRDRVLSEGVAMMVIPSAGGDQEQVTLPLDLLPGFFFKLEPERFAPAIQERVHAFRRECYAALFRHFYGQPAATPIGLPASLDAARDRAPALIAAIAATTERSVRRYLHQHLAADAARLGLDPPPLDDIGHAHGADMAIAALLDAARVLTARRCKWNHLSRSGAGAASVAINLPELARLFARHDIDLGFDLAAALARPARDHRVHRRTIDSAFARRPVHCVVIEAWS